MGRGHIVEYDRAYITENGEQVMGPILHEMYMSADDRNKAIKRFNEQDDSGGRTRINLYLTPIKLRNNKTQAFLVIT